jgi:hypothetical protein
MLVAIQRQARIFMAHERMFAEYAENPSEEDVKVISEKYYQALLRPTGDLAKDQKAYGTATEQQTATKNGQQSSPAQSSSVPQQKK